MPSPDPTDTGAARQVVAVCWVFPELTGRLSLLGDETVVLGRDQGCQVELPGNETSRTHAEIRRDGPLHILRDLGSRNGSFINGDRVTEAPLAPGLVVRLGEWLGVVVGISDGRPARGPVFAELAHGMVGGPTLAAVADQVRTAAASTLPIVLVGETGTGKEGFARAIHTWSRGDAPFVAVNCATLVPTLAEAELFGHRKGAFTGADHASVGLIRAANGGTLLLDEVTDLPEAVQAKLLRVLQQQEVVPLGDSAPIPVDVRVVAATQTPLVNAVNDRRFRTDLCARLDGLTVRLPPLRERREEIVALFWHFLRLHSGGRTPEVEVRLLEQLCVHDWPFNVRELELLARRLLVFHGHEPVLRRAWLPQHILERETNRPAVHGLTPPPQPESHAQRRSRELAKLRQALRVHDGNVARAAAAAGLSRQRAYRLMGADSIALAAADADDEDEDVSPSAGTS